MGVFPVSHENHEHEHEHEEERDTARNGYKPMSRRPNRPGG
jgi:hypothetical protein